MSNEKKQDLTTKTFKTWQEFEEVSKSLGYSGMAEFEEKTGIAFNSLRNKPFIVIADKVFVEKKVKKQK